MKHSPPVGDTAGAQPSSRRPFRRRVAAFATVALVVFTVPRASEAAEHVVTPGETLDTIAPRYESSVDAIAEANAISDVHRIFAGQILTIPSGASSPTSALSGPNTHTVVAGETLSEVADRFGTTVAGLSSLNGIADPNLVREGTVLTLSARSPAGDAAPASHEVVAGDTLAAIANAYGTTVSSVAAANGLSDPNFVRVGATLLIGPGPARAQRAESVHATHTVREGETLAAIAGSYGTTVNAMADANGLNNPNIVTIGAVLTIPAARPGSTNGGQAVGTTVAPLLEQWARVYGVPVDLLKALTWFESGWNNDVVSSVGAIGVGQLMPDTVDFVSKHLLDEAVDPHDLSDNIRTAARFIRYLLDETSWDATEALAAYYQGLTALRRDGIYASSWFYIDGILSLRDRF